MQNSYCLYHLKKLAEQNYNLSYGNNKSYYKEFPYVCLLLRQTYTAALALR